MMTGRGVLEMKNNSVWFSGPLIAYATAVATAITVYLILDGSDIVESSRTFLRVSGRVGMGLSPEWILSQRRVSGAQVPERILGQISTVVVCIALRRGHRDPLTRSRRT